MQRGIGPLSRVAACIIGDEILAGRTIDTNSNYFAKKCFDYGLNLAQIRVIPDVKSEIISTVRELSLSFALVLTSGGIGPTHDDLTYDSIAEAFNLPLIPDQDTVAAMHKHYQTTALNKGQLRMATVPRPDCVYRTPGLWVPLVQTRNVLILPGVPILFRKMVDYWFEHGLSKEVSEGKLIASPRTRLSLKTQWKESDLAEQLASLQESVKEQGIMIGSYPKLLEDDSTHVIISLSGSKECAAELESLADKIRRAFQATSVEP